MRRLVLGVAVAALVVVGAACRPGVDPVAPEAAYTSADTWAAIDATFAPFGGQVLWCAREIVWRESGGNPYAINGRYQGAWQMHSGFDQTIQNLAAAYGFGFASRFDPWLATWAARDAYLMYGSFRVNWAASVPAGCP